MSLASSQAISGCGVVVMTLWVSVSDLITSVVVKGVRPWVTLSVLVRSAVLMRVRVISEFLGGLGRGNKAKRLVTICLLIALITCVNLRLDSLLGTFLMTVV